MANLTQKKLEQELRNSIAELTPAWKEGPSDCAVKPTKKEPIQMKKQSARPVWRKSLIGIAAAFILFFTGIFAGQGVAAAKESVIFLDVNPSIELRLNHKDQVKKVVARNKDAAALIAQQDLKGLSAEQALTLLMEDLISGGYLKAEDPNAILLSVENRDAGKADALRQALLGGIRNTLNSHQLSASVLSQSVQQPGKSDAATLAEQYGVSYGKIVFLQKLCELDPSLTLEELAPLPLREIAALVAKNKLDLSLIVDYDPGDSLQENIADAIEDLDEAGNQSDLIGWDRAIQIAQQAVGGGTVVDRDLEFEHGIRAYEIELRLEDGTRYEVTIDAVSGEVFKKHREDQDEAPSSSVPSSFIGMDRAVSIALGRVNGKVVEKELDRDDQEYEISIFLDDFCYEVKINALTGEIRKIYKEKEHLDAEDYAERNGVSDYDDDWDDEDDDWDDDDRPVSTPHNPSGSKSPASRQPNGQRPGGDDDDWDDDDDDRDDDDWDDEDDD